MLASTLIDYGIYDDCLKYAALGLDPGSCATCILSDDLDGAYRKSHRADTDVLLDTYRFIHEVFPDFIMGDIETVREWCSHNGYKNAPLSSKALFDLSVDSNFMAPINKWISKTK